MLEYLKKEANKTLTENGAVTLESTQSECLDLFATIGALRSASEEDIKQRFSKAFAENPDLAMKIAFYGRDIRGGLGERRVFRIILNWLSTNGYPSLIKNIKYIPEYGRFDDMIDLIEAQVPEVVNETFKVIKEQYDKDRENFYNKKPISLLAKWLPSINASSAKTKRLAKKICKHFNFKEKDYRYLLASWRKFIGIIENNLRVKDYSFDYSKQPSKAMLKYRKAFMRNDSARYQAFIEAVKKGEKTIHTGTLFPYDIVKPIVNAGWRTVMSEEERASLDVTWESLEDFTNDENAICVVDGSGSMYGYGNPTPAQVAQSLGIYFAERNTGAFHNHFITFSSRPRLVEIKGRDIFEKVRYCMQFDECSNTNLEATFNLILRTAVLNNLRQEDLPTKMYIISDMEFDRGTSYSDLTIFENAKRKFKNQGYILPQVVFWNVQSRNLQQPVSMNEQGVVLVSGCSPRIFQMITNGLLTPYAFMMDVLGKERYACITA